MKDKNDENKIDTPEKQAAQGMTRREVLQLFAGVAAVSACPALIPGCTTLTSKVASAWIPKGGLGDSYAVFKAVMASATDFSWLSSGDSVLIKIAANSGAGYPASTDPTALKFMINLLKEKKAGTIYVGEKASPEQVFRLANTSQSRAVLSGASTGAAHFMESVFSLLETDTISTGSTRDVCVQNGLMQAIDDAGATACFFDEAAYTSYSGVSSSLGHWTTPVYIPGLIAGVNHIVNMPPCVDDYRTGASTGMLNVAGLLRDDCRIAMSSKSGDDFYQMCVDINLLGSIASKTRLTMTSGMSILTTAGTDPGTVFEPDYGLIFASDNLLVHDLMAASWVAANRETVNTATDVYLLPAIKYYIGKKGKPVHITWNQINAGPGTAVAAYLNTFMKV